jgi:hypothetical protein
VLRFPKQLRAPVGNQGEALGGQGTPGVGSGAGAARGTFGVTQVWGVFGWDLENIRHSSDLGFTEPFPLPVTLVALSWAA